MAGRGRGACPWREKACRKGGPVSFYAEGKFLQVEHRIPDVLGEEKARYDGKLTMVVGAGASAATVLQSLKALGNTKVS